LVIFLEQINNLKANNVGYIWTI